MGVFQQPAKDFFLPLKSLGADREAAVYDQILARNERGIFACHEVDGGSDLLRFSGPAEQSIALVAFPERLGRDPFGHRLLKMKLG